MRRLTPHFLSAIPSLTPLFVTLRGLCIRRYSYSATCIILFKITDRFFRYASPRLCNPYLFVNFILVPVPAFLTHLFLHPSLVPLLIHHSAHPPSSVFHSRLKTYTSFTNPTPVVVSLLPPGLPSQTFAGTISSDSYSFLVSVFPYFFRFCAVR